MVFIAELKFQQLCSKCIGGSVYGCYHLAMEMLLLIGCCDFFIVVNAFNFFCWCAFNFGGKDFLIQPHDALRRLRSAIVLFSVADETFRCIRSPLFQALYSGRSFPSHFSLPDQPQKHPISPPTTLPEHLPPSARAPHFAGTPICRAGFPFENLLGKMWSKTPDGMVDSTILGIDSFQRRSANPKGSWLGGKGH